MQVVTRVNMYVDTVVFYSPRVPRK